jgi:hypothetical protein
MCGGKINYFIVVEMALLEETGMAGRKGNDCALITQSC